MQFGTQHWILIHWSGFTSSKPWWRDWLNCSMLMIILKKRHYWTKITLLKERILSVWLVFSVAPHWEFPSQSIVLPVFAKKKRVFVNVFSLEWPLSRLLSWIFSCTLTVHRTSVGCCSGLREPEEGCLKRPNFPFNWREQVLPHRKEKFPQVSKFPERSVYEETTRVII